MQEKEKLWTPSFVLLTLANFVVALAYYLVAMKIVEYAYSAYHVSYSAAGAMVTLYAAASVTTRFVFGARMDSWGLRRSALVGGGLIVVASGLYVLEAGYWPLAGMRILHGIAFAMNTGALAAIAALLVPKSRQGEGIGYFSLSTAAAMAIGPLLAMVMTNNGASYRFLFVFTLVISLAAFASLLLVRVPEPSKEERRARRQASRHLGEGGKVGVAAEAVASPLGSVGRILGQYIHLGILPIASLAIPLMFCYSGVLSFMTSFAAERNLNDAASLYFLVYAVSMLVTRPMMGKRLDRRGENAVLYLTLAVASAGLAVLAVSFSGPVLLASAVLMGFGTGATQSSVQAIVARYAAKEDLGKANSTYFLCLDLGLGIGPVIIGAFLPVVGYTVTFLILAAIALASCGYYHLVHGRKVARRGAAN